MTNTNLPPGAQAAAAWQAKWQAMQRQTQAPTRPTHLGHHALARRPVAHHVAQTASVRATPVTQHAAVHPAAVHNAAPLFALSTPEAVGIMALMLLALPVSFLISRSALSRHFPALSGVARWVALTFATLVVWAAIYMVGGLALGPLVAVFGDAAVAMAILGWLIAGVGVYLVEIYFIRAGWTRLSARNTGGASNWLVALVSRGGVRYVLTALAGMLPSVMAFEIAAGLLHMSAVYGVSLLIGCGIASFFHPPSFFLYRSIAPLVSGAWLGRRQRGNGAPPLEPPPPKRGTWLVNADSAIRYLAWLKSSPTWPADPIPFGTQVIHAREETYHSQIVGTTGAGKSTAIRAMLRTVAQRPHQRAIVADYDGGYASVFYRPDRGDLILNPFDARSACWDLFGELRAKYDPDQLAAALVPEALGEGRKWSDYATQFVASCIRALQAKSQKPPSSLDLWRLVSSTPPAVLAGMLADTPAAAFLAKSNERMYESIHSTASSAVQGLWYLNQDGPRMTITDWVNRGKGWLFLTYKQEQLDAIKGVMATWIKLAISRTLSLSPGDAGLWFVVDELDALGKINGLTDALPRMRKVGGRSVLGYQVIGPLNELYGPNMVAALVENCHNTMVLKCGGKGDDGTSAYAASLLGKREVAKTQRQSSASGGTQGDGSQHSGWSTSETTSDAIEDVLLASEVQGFPILSGVCHAPGFNFWSHFSLPPDSMPVIAPAFEPRPPEAQTPGTAPPAGPPNTPAPAEVIPLVMVTED